MELKWYLKQMEKYGSNLYNINNIMHNLFNSTNIRRQTMLIKLNDMLELDFIFEVEMPIWLINMYL